MPQKVNLTAAFARFTEPWSPKIAGDINDVQIKLAKFRGEFKWHHHDDEDELFLVRNGRMLMRFRDRDEIVGAGEFIIVPRGVEHCPAALTQECEVVLIEPNTTLNTGNVENAAVYRRDEERVAHDPEMKRCLERWRSLLAEPPVVEVYRLTKP